MTKKTVGRAGMRLFAALGVTILSACSGGSSGGGGPQPTGGADQTSRPLTGSTIETAKTTIGPKGGTLNWASSVDPATGDTVAGGALVIPPGALAESQTISVAVTTTQGRALKHTIVYEFAPEGLQFSKPCSLTIGYSESWISENKLQPSRVHIFGIDAKHVDGVVTQSRDDAANTLTAEISHFSIWFPVPAVVLSQQAASIAGRAVNSAVQGLYDAPSLIDKDGKPLVDEDGAPLDPGHTFWQPGSSAVIIHGLLSSPDNFIGGDLGNLLEAEFGAGRVAYYGYPSLKPIKDNAQALELRLKGRKGLPGLHIYGHSMGGLVARSYLELVGDSGQASTLVTLGTPHLGVDIRGAGGELLDHIQKSEFGFVLIEGETLLSSLPELPGGLGDLDSTGSFLSELNAKPNRSYPPYYVVIAQGDIVVDNNDSERGAGVIEASGEFVAKTSLLNGHSELHQIAKSIKGASETSLTLADRLNYWNSLGHVAGFVELSDGSRLSGVEVSLKSGGSVVRSVLTDSSGWYYLNAVQRGNFEVEGKKQGFQMAPRSVDIKTREQIVANLAATAHTGPSFPPAPNGVGVYYQAASQFNLITWNPSPGATSYDVFWGTSAGVTAGSNELHTNNASFGHTGIQPGQQYYYRVRASNNSGDSVLSTEVSVLVPQPLPATPTGTGVAYQAASLRNLISWSSATDATSYEVFWGTKSGVTTSSNMLPATSTTSFGHTGVQPGYRYYYRVRSVNSAGRSSLSTEVNALVPQSAPGTPTGVSATYQAGNQRNLVAWNLVSGATSYEVFWGTNSNVTTSSNMLPATSTTSFGHTGVQPGYRYYYRVRSVNSAGRSSLSTEVNALVPQSAPGTPTGVSAAYDANNNYNLVRWDQVGSATSYQVFWGTSSGVTTGSNSLPATNTLEFGHSGGVSGVRYYYRVRSQNSVGASGLSSEVSVLVP